MPVLILWPLVALAVVALGVATLRYVPPALAQRRHAAVIARIAVLERELGLAAPTAGEGDVLGRQIAAAMRLERAREPDKRLYGHCEQCRRRVALNVGYCELDAGQRARCAKELWRTS